MSKILIQAIVLVTFCGVLMEARNRNESRCFQFTWLGPSFHSESVFLNATCQTATRLASGVPCQAPLVVSKNRTWPDTRYIWDNYADEATCVLDDSAVCAQYTYYFNGHPLNSTYMCTKAVDSNNTAITSGCYQETNGSFSTRVCICRSMQGVMPCNSATMLSNMFATCIIFIFPFIINLFWRSVHS